MGHKHDPMVMQPPRRLPAGVKIYHSLPEGWKKINDALTAPDGYIWIWNGKSILKKEFRHGLLKLKT